MQNAFASSPVNNAYFGQLSEMHSDRTLPFNVRQFRYVIGMLFSSRLVVFQTDMSSEMIHISLTVQHPGAITVLQITLRQHYKEQHHTLATQSDECKDVTPCSPVTMYRRFRRSNCLIHHTTYCHFEGRIMSRVNLNTTKTGA